MLDAEPINFVLTNAIPRKTFTRFIGWASAIEQPMIRDVSIALWRWFADVDLSDARKTRFASLHDAFTRELAPGARPYDPDPRVLASPCDALVGASGSTDGIHLLQIKGSRYSLAELLRDADLASAYAGGCYATLRLTAGMYHRFHAPCDVTVERVTFVSGDAFNVNRAALKRIARLYCRNARAILRLRLAAAGEILSLVPVGAVLVSSIRLPFLDGSGRVSHRSARDVACNARFTKGEEIGWFEHGSTIVVVAPRGYELCGGVHDGAHIRAGTSLMRATRNALTQR